jgi:hypothetical protein
MSNPTLHGIRCAGVRMDLLKIGPVAALVLSGIAVCLLALAPLGLMAHTVCAVIVGGTVCISRPMAMTTCATASMSADGAIPLPNVWIDGPASTGRVEGATAEEAVP